MAGLDFPAFGDALWYVSDHLGIRPEWQLPVIALETKGTFDPAIMNQSGCVGLNQFCQSAYPRYVPVPVSEYRSWPASRQLSGPIFNYWQDAQAFGYIRSSTRLMLAQLGQGIPARASTLNSIVFSSPSNEYSSNASFDPDGKGYITVQDVANALSYRARQPAVQQALALAYSIRPGESPRDPVYGDDYGMHRPGPSLPVVAPVRAPSTIGPVFAAMGALALAVAAGYGANRFRRA